MKRKVWTIVNKKTGFCRSFLSQQDVVDSLCLVLDALGIDFDVDEVTYAVDCELETVIYNFRIECREIDC